MKIPIAVAIAYYYISYRLLGLGLHVSYVLVTNSHFISEHQIEDKANDSKHNAHSWEYTVGDEELHCHSLMLMSPRSASCVHNVQELKSQKYMICTWEQLQ